MVGWRQPPWPCRQMTGHLGETRPGHDNGSDGKTWESTRGIAQTGPWGASSSDEQQRLEETTLAQSETVTFMSLPLDPA